jgi:hypothetical protein
LQNPASHQIFERTWRFRATGSMLVSVSVTPLNGGHTLLEIGPCPGAACRAWWPEVTMQCAGDAGGSRSRLYSKHAVLKRVSLACPFGAWCGGLCWFVASCRGRAITITSPKRLWVRLRGAPGVGGSAARLRAGSKRGGPQWCQVALGGGNAPDPVS